MKIYKNKTIISYLSLLISFILIEIIFRLISGFEVFNLSFIRAFLLYNMISIIFGYLSSKIKGIHTYIINASIILISCIYALAQVGFNNYLSVYMSFKSTSQLGAVTSYIMEFMASLKPIYYALLIPIILLIVFYVLICKLKKNRNYLLKLKYKYTNIIIANAMLILLISSGLVFNVLLDKKFTDKTQIIENKVLFKTGANPALCIKNFGVIPYSIIVFYTKNIKEEEELLLISYAEEEKVTDYTRYIDDTKWNELINSETNKTLNNLNEYYINKKITPKNEYTGLLENKNLIVIMMESVNDIIINKEYFPNFYKLYTHGYSFDNNYSPRNSCATGNNEFSAITSLYSIANTCTMNTYINNTYEESMFAKFRKAGYTVETFHDFTEGYYKRSIAHINFGAEKYYGVQSLGIPFEVKYGEWASDEDFMNKYLTIIDEYDKEKPFFSYITTVSSHMPYSASSAYGDIYLDLTEDTNYSMEIRRYYSKLKVLDNALGILLNGLEERGLLDNTAIVLFGDHYPYGISNDTLKEVLDRPLEDNEKEKVPLVIYSKDLTPTKFDTYTSYINLFPTLANLYNLDYDPRVYEGIDIFSEDYNNIVAFADYSWKNDLAYYDSKTNKITYYTDFTYTEEEIKAINEEIYVKMNASTLSIKNNYFNYLEKYIDK